MDDVEKQKNETIKYKRNGLLWVELSMEYNRHVQLQYVLEHLGDKGSNPKLRKIKMSPVFSWWKREMLRQRWREINETLHYNDVTKKIEAKYSDFANERAEEASKQMNSLQTLQNPPIKDLVSLEALSDLNSFVIPHVAITSNLSGFNDADYCQSTIVDEITGVSESEIPPAFRSKGGRKSKNGNNNDNDDSYEYDSAGNRIEGNNSKKGSKNGSNNSKNNNGSNSNGKSNDNSDGNNNSNFGGGIFGFFKGSNNPNNSKNNGPENSDKNGKSENQRSSRGKGRNGSGKNNGTNGNDTNDDYYDDYYSVDPNNSKDGNNSPRRHHRSGRNNSESLKDANGNPISPRNKSRRSNNSNNNGNEGNEDGIAGNGVHSRKNGSKGPNSSKGDGFSADFNSNDEI
ncbi:hypothetical protein TVAG_085690 [Trichomonas vaginalis G3]|uniref:Uncharacterized protein n=1 Tax=Trichomonas vaginalis (strain ATCC PRA-98 / G3) TaxID=412133 RepID=A2F310_TRIV3|nr:hypothetical protein TVAGG3_0830000 [Trichomonas vaginalis G3]EAY00735.1 hypothetical protein TVAG_085690 [Trichomonas vaginalis G3]KAI5498517.1 hypothetical protein TVAGG3_0830000 [Trichomonas vaginalis G3]|eukprot:XP_001313664.1 hypothetical protein [Trichomonas vaginalis G3]